jgi:Arylsulfotransferase (ASST)
MSRRGGVALTAAREDRLSDPACRPFLGPRLALVLLCPLAALCLPGTANGSSVSVFPIPGGRVAAPRTQIAFRGVPASRLSGIVVTGSASGRHAGTIESDSDGQGGSFVPAEPFAPGEVVTVRSSLQILGAGHGTFRFAVASPAGPVPPQRSQTTPRTRGDVWRFRSAPGLAPASVEVTKRARSNSGGDIFLAPQAGPIQNGPEIIDPSGNLVWFQPAPATESAADFRVQTYDGRPVLTWWQGSANGGFGGGVDLIYNTGYQQIAAVRAANGLSADLHEFQITPARTAWITAFYPVYWDARSVNRPRRQIVLDCAVQEIDIRTGLVLFQWDSLDHVPLTDSHAAVPPHKTREPFDYFHLNSIDVDDDGNLVLSARNSWAAYKINQRTGAIIWTLGGKHSSFKMGPGASFAFQHDVRVRSRHDWFVTVFDDGGGPPAVHRQSRGLELFLDVKHKTARRVDQREHSPHLTTFFEGNFQQLPGLDDFIGWGAQSYFTEYDRRGRVVLDGRFVGINNSYRAYRFPWTGAPRQPPSVAAGTSGRHATVYASWNGATAVGSWRVLGGTNTGSLHPAATARKLGFETPIMIASQPYVAIQALDGRGRVLAQSATIQTK